MRLAHLVTLGAIVGSALGCGGADSTQNTIPDASAGSGGGSQDSSLEVLEATAAEDAQVEEGSAEAAGEGGCDPAVQMTSETCKSCVEAIATGKCAAAREACAQDDGCKAIAQCISDCGTNPCDACVEQECESACIRSNADAGPHLFAYVACVDTGCHDECFCAGCRFGAPLCNSCLVSSCADTCNGCDLSSECMSLVYCIAYQCNDPSNTACFQNCEDTFDGGATAYEAFGQCGQTSCPAECGF